MDINTFLPAVRKNVLLKNYTTFRIGGPARYFFEAKSKDDLFLAIKTAKRFNLSFFILGRGSNLLVSDKGYKGLVIKIKSSKIKSQKDVKTIFAEAGVSLIQLVNFSFKKALTGLEWASGIPGTVSGAVFGNAGAFGKSMKDAVVKIEVFNAKTLKFETYNSKDCKFAYRESIFKKKKHLIITSVIIKLKKGKKIKIKKKIKECLGRKKKSQPLNYASVGSIFKNPNKKSAGKLIEDCGLKGKRIGKAKISEKHTNFIVNLGDARAENVKKLINFAKKAVKKRFGVSLREEIQYLGFEN